MRQSGLLSILIKKRDAARAEADRLSKLIKTLETELGIEPQKKVKKHWSQTPQARARAARKMRKQWKLNRNKMLGKG